MIGDDSKSDMAGADLMGIKKIQKRHEGVRVEKVGPESPDLVFDHYDELIALINAS
jgi:FMN phosphatase YigB (HAD superfamily)